MDPLVLRTALWRNLASLAVVTSVLALCVVMVYQGQAFWDFGLTDPNHENGLRFAFLIGAIACSWGVSRDLDRLIFRTPVVYADREGLSVRGAPMVPWSQFRGIEIGGFTINYVFKVRHLEILAGRKWTVPNFQLSHRPRKMAALINDYAVQIATAGPLAEGPVAEGPVTAAPNSAAPVRPRRPGRRAEEQMSVPQPMMA